MHIADIFSVTTKNVSSELQKSGRTRHELLCFWVFTSQVLKIEDKLQGLRQNISIPETDSSKVLTLDLNLYSHYTPCLRKI